MISRRSLEKKYHVRYDSHVDCGAFVVTTPGGDVTFTRCLKTRFSFLDLDDYSNAGAVMLVQTVRRRFEGFTRMEIEDVIEACKLQARTGPLNLLSEDLFVLGSAQQLVHGP